MNLYAWSREGYIVGESGYDEEALIILYTLSETPNVGDLLYKSDGTPAEQGELKYNDGTNEEVNLNNTVYRVGNGYIDVYGISETGYTELAPDFSRDSQNDLEVETEKPLSKLTIKGKTYYVKDAQAREDILNKQDKIDANNKLSTNLIDGLSIVATSGSYNDLSNKPTIPIVNDATITITQGGTTKGTFTVNQNSNTTIALDAGGGDSLPDQTGQAGKFLTTDGTDASWAEVQGGSSSTITYFDSTNWTLDVTNTILSTGLSLGNNVNVFKNGQLIEPGVSNDYTISNNNIVFTEPLISTDKVAVINGNMNPMQSVGYNTFSNKSISATDWVIDTDNTYPGYSYKCDIPCTGVTSTMYAQVTFAPEEAMSGNYANICDTGTGVITIYSKVAEAITIPMIMVLGV